MNFYTLTFKKKILLSFLLIFLMIVFMDVMLVVVADRKTTKDSFIDEKISKIKHFKYNYSKDIDIVFVGSSRTFYHISTNEFFKNSINVYNLGVSGAQFEDYPTIIGGIVHLKPKKVIISLSLNRLFDNINISAFPTLKELKNYYSVDKWLFLKALNRYVINFHTFLHYSKPIYYKIKSTYKKFDYKDISLSDTNSSKQTNAYEYYSNLVNCKIFDIKRPFNKRVFLKCKNGDGVIVGSHIAKQETTNVSDVLEKFNTKSVQYLKIMINELSINDIGTTIILEPIYKNTYRYDIDKIKSLFPNAKIVDLTNYKIQKNKWGDAGHLNYKGKKQYSEHLSNLYKLNML